MEKAWDIDALRVARDHGRSIGNARDLVILDWLAKGDARPFADWIMCGHAPSHEVLLALAVMMTRGDNARFDPAGLDPKMREVAEIFPFCIEVTGKGRRGRDQENVTRGRGIALAVAKEMAQGSSYNDALDTVTDWLPTVGVFVERDAVEKAYKTHKPKRSGTNSR